MVRPRRADIHQWNGLADHHLLQRMLKDIGLCTCETLWDGNTEIVSKCNTCHAIADINLVTKPNHFDLAVTADRIADSDHRVGEVDEPGPGAGPLHVTHDF